MSYVICSNATGGGDCVARRYFGNFTARDYIAPLRRDYFGKYVCSGVLSFETIEKAKQYRERYDDIKAWYIREYDPCMNAIK